MFNLPLLDVIGGMARVKTFFWQNTMRGWLLLTLALSVTLVRAQTADSDTVSADPSASADVAVSGTVTVNDDADVAPATTLTWETCVELATRHNPQLEAAVSNVLNADAARLGAYSNFWPQIRANIGGNRGWNDRGAAGTDYTNSFSAQLSLTQTIFDGFATQAGVDRARAQLNYAFASLNSQKAATSYALKAAFAQLLYAQRLVETNRGILAIRQQTERLIGLRFEGGFESKGNWLLTVASRDQAQLDLNQAMRNREVSERQLLTVIGKINLPLPVRADGELNPGTLPVKPDFDQLALQTPAYLQYQAQTEAARAGVQSAQAGWWPTISASVSGGTGGDHFFPNDTASASGGITVSYPIFQGGSTYFSVSAAQASLRQTLANLRGGTNQAALTLAQAFKSYVDAVETIPVQASQLAAAELRYKTYEVLYNNGKATFQDFNTNTDSYVSIQTRYLAAQRDAVIQESNWEQARGLGSIP
ncbi:MAG: TolC family protein [Verrucomicrobiales bacterium]|nr:TolC family protein [Verrucomicrobiales bacterium]